MSFEEPLFHIHLNVDYPFNLTGILFFPQLKKNFEPQKDKIQLYSNQVFVTDAVENIVFFIDQNVDVIIGINQSGNGNKPT